MTGLYVIVSRRGGAHLARRRSGYRQVAVDGTQAYVREEHNSGFLGTREGDLWSPEVPSRKFHC